MTALRRVPVVALSAVVALVLLHVLVSPLYGPHRYDRTDAVVAATVVAVALTVAAWGAGRLVPWLEQHRWVRRGLVVAHLAATVVVQCTVGNAISVPPGFDAGIVHTIAATLALERPLAEGLPFYLAVYPNNWLLTSVLHRWYDLWLDLGGQDVLTAAIVLNAVALTASVVLAYLTLRRMSRPAAAYVLLGLSWVFIGLSPWVAVPYSDTLAMPFTALVLYLFSVERTTSGARWWRALLWCGMAATGVVGYHVKPTAVFVLGAVVLVALVCSGRPARSTALAATTYAGAVVAGVVVASALVSTATDGLAARAVDVDPSLRLDASHFLKMGAQQGAGPHNDYYGVYSEGDITETRTLEPGPERIKRNVERFAERVAEMGPLGYPRFLWDKAAWFGGDGSFFMWGEGGMVLDPMPWTATDDLSAGIRSWFFIGGDHWSTLFALWQGAWLVVLLLVALTPLGRRADVGGPVAGAARVSLLVLIVFLLLFEARSRYLVLYLPFVLLVASLTLDSLVARVATRGGVRRGAVTPSG